MGKLVLVAHYYDWAEAHIALGALRSAGVTAFVHGHEHIALRPLSMMALGGVRLVVPEGALDEALGVLEEAVANPNTDGEVLERDDRWWVVGLCLFSMFLLYSYLYIPYAFRVRRWRERAVG